MNESIARPSNPYIKLTDQHWEPYLELLLRTVRLLVVARLAFAAADCGLSLTCCSPFLAQGIAMLHPKDPTRVKLTEFHT